MILPFGYMMENGKIIVDEHKAEIVKQAVQSYLNGTSLKIKAEELEEKEVEYAPGKSSWNKNRVQRMLADPRYCGTDQYPAIIDRETFDKVQQTMASRNTQQECNRQNVFSSSVVPILCGKCGKPTFRRHDGRFQNCTKHICINPDCKAIYPIADQELWKQVQQILVKTTPVAAESDDALMLDLHRLKNEIERDMQSLDIDSQSLQKKIFEYAALQYKSKSPLSKESMDFSQRNPRSPDFIREIKRRVSAVLLIDKQTIGLRLTDGQEVGKG